MQAEHGEGSVRIYLLGRFSVTAGERLVIDQCWPRRKAKGLLKMLALNKGRWLHREQVQEALWEDADPAAAYHNFRQNLHYLRQAFAGHGLAVPVVTAAHSMLALSPEAWVDVVEFRRRSETARSTRTDAALYEQALGLYAGELLPEDMYDDWTQQQREELTALHAQVLLELARLHELQGRPASAAERLEELLRADPLDEEAHRSLMRLYASTGQRQRALNQYHRCREALRQDLGVEPSETTQALYREVQQGAVRPSAGPAPARGPFIGRQREMGQLRAGLEEAVAGRGQIFLLAGEAGMGKTRLAEEFALHARLLGADVVWGRCHEGKGAPAYWPWVQALGSYLDEHSLDELTVGARTAEDVAALVGEERPATAGIQPAALLADEGRFRLFDSVHMFLAEASRRRPLVLILDDLHRADRASLLMLEFLAPSFPGTRLFLLATYRDTEAGPQSALTGTLTILDRHFPGRTIGLEGLPQSATGRLMESAGGREMEARMVAAVHGRTGGNPFLVQQLTHVIVAGGLSDSPLDERGWETLLPRGAQSVILQSLSRLSEGSRDVLSVAAVVGKEFGLDVLCRLPEMRNVPVLSALDEAVAARIIDQSGRARFGFRHVLLRDALYEQLSMARRAQLHRSVGEALEQVWGPEHAAELGHHFVEAAAAGMAGRAVHYMRLAGDRAMALFAYEEAVSLYQKALDAQAYEQTPNGALRAELMLALGLAQWDAGDPAGGRTTLQAAAAVARRSGAYEQVARAALLCGRSLYGAGTVDAPVVSLLQEALANIRPKDSALRAMLLASLAKARYWADSAETRTALCREALAIARRTHDTAALVHVLDCTLSALWFPDNAGERLELAKELLRVVESMGDKARTHWAHRWLMVLRLELGDVVAARHEFEALARLAQELRQPAQQENITRVSAMWSLLEGRLDEGERLARQALAEAQRNRSRAASEEFGIQMLVSLWERGRLAAAEAPVRAFAAEYPSNAGWRAVLALIYAEGGREADARAELEHLVKDDFSSLPRDFNWTTLAAILAEVCAYLADKRRAAVLYRQLLPLARLNVVTAYALACAGSIERSLGILAATMHRYRKAAQHFEAALEMNKRMGARPWLAMTLHNYAQMLVRRGRPGDRPRAETLLEQVMELARASGMRGLEGRAASFNHLTGDAPANRKRAAPSPRSTPAQSRTTPD